MNLANADLNNKPPGQLVVEWKTLAARRTVGVMAALTKPSICRVDVGVAPL